MLDFFTRIRLYVSVIYVTCLNLGWMFHKIEMLVIVFLLSTTSITAHADTNANPGASPSGLVTFNKMLEFKDLKEIESFGLTYSPKPSPFKSIPDKLVPRLTGKKWSNGKYTVEGKGVYKSGGSCLSYEYKVDLKTRTYTAAPIESYDLDDSYLKLQAMDSNVNRKALKSAQDAGVNVEEMPSEQMDVCQQSPKDF